MNITFAIVNHNLKSLFRNFKSSGIMFILPVAFMGIFAFAFGGSPSGFSFRAGIVEPETATEFDIEELFNELNDQNESVEITVQTYDSVDALTEAVQNNEVLLGVVSKGVSVNEGSSPMFLPRLTVYGSETGRDFPVARSIILEALLPAWGVEENLLETELVNTADESEATTGFTLLVPGLIVYGLLILLPGIAQSFTEITQKGYIFRYAASQTNSVHIVLGNTIYYFIVGIVQVFLLYGTALMYGYDAQGSVILALIPALVTLVFVIGLGLLLGGFFKKTDAATNIGTIFSIILGFFSGSFIVGIGNVLEFQLLGRAFQFNDFIPTKWATQALDSILGQGKGLGDITTELIILTISAIVAIVLGIIVYQKQQLQAGE